MTNNKDLTRFLDAQEQSFETALGEIKQGRKRSHWIWFIFPQLEGLGLSSTAKFYGIHDLEEATSFLAHPVLGKRLVQISEVLLQLESSDPHEIFGSPDDLKLRSSMTLFSLVTGADPVFQKVLAKYFNNQRDERTVNMLHSAG